MENKGPKKRTNRLSRLKEDLVLSNPSSPRSPVAARTDTPKAAGEANVGASQCKKTDIAVLATRELQERLFRLVLGPLVPEHAQLIAVEDRPIVGAPREGSTEAAVLLRRRIDAIEAQNTELQSLWEQTQALASADEAKNKVLCDHSAAFREESELLHHQIDEMSGMMNKLIAENARYPIQLKPILRWCYRLVDQAGAGAREDVGWQKVSAVEDCADIQSLRACNLKLEAEMTQIKANNVKSMKMLMKELSQKDEIIAQLKHGSSAQ